MKNIRSFLIVFISVLGGLASFAQTNLLNAKTPKQIGIKSAAQIISDNDKPLEYGYVNDRDVLMGKTVWEIIDLSERINFPLYFPIDTANIGSDRRSLYDVLTKAIRSGEISEVYSDSYFNTKKSYKDIQASLTRIDTADAGREQINAGQKISPEYIIKQDLTSQDVTQYKIKGYWYFDKRLSELKYRLIGICPIAPEAKEKDSENPDYIELFWVYFPSIRDILHEAKSFNNRNSSMPVDFDTLLNSRKFNAVIYQEENVQGDRTIEKYTKDNAQMQLLESERVKEKIRDFEHDMWNY
jgi:gliding motility associated protien GldN